MPAAVAALLAAALLWLAAPVPAAAATDAYVAVSVATLWVRSGLERPADRPSLTRPVDMPAWSRALDTPLRRGLVGRLETQALYGDRVRVLERRGRWSRVVVPGQPTPRDGRGYPGWLPSVQLVRRAPPRGTGETATVTATTAWLRDGLGRRRLELSYGTRLPVVSSSSGRVAVGTPGRGTGWLERAAVRIGRPPEPTGDTIVADARRFLGVRYLWGGTSAFGWDCSGLIHRIHRVHGITIPRDADAQAAAGTPVARADLRAGDLVFYGRARVHHVALYAGGGRMIEAPNSGASVRLAPFRTADYAGARRYAG